MHTIGELVRVTERHESRLDTHTKQIRRLELALVSSRIKLGIFCAVCAAIGSAVMCGLVAYGFSLLK